MKVVAPTLVALLLAAGTVSPAMAAPTPVPTTAATATASDPEKTDRDNADRDWVYSAGWTHAAGEGWTAQSYGGSESYSNTAGATASLTFTGSSIELVGALGPNEGRVRAWVDCGEPITLDLYAPHKVYGQSLTTFAGLPAGTHTMVVEILGTRRAESTDAYGVIDVARIIDDPALADPGSRWHGTADSYSDEPIELRRTGCGSQSDLISQLKLISSGGWFAAGDAWGAVNGHSARVSTGRAAPGPIVVAGAVREAATLGLTQRTPATVDVDLPDQSRSLLLWVSADELVGGSALVGVTDPDTGDFLPARVLSGVPGEWSQGASISEAVVVEPGAQRVLVVDLAGVGGTAAIDEVTVWASSAEPKPAELVILQGRVSDLSAARLALEVAAGVGGEDAGQLSARADAFSRGPVVLTRVLADAAQSAWTADDKPVALNFARTLTVSGEKLSADAMSVILPPVGWPNSTSTVHVRFETAQRCRSLTASVGLADSTASRPGASVSVSVLGDGEPLTIKHNGLWAGVDYPGASRNPVTDGQIREELADELLASKGVALGSPSPAVSALIAAQSAALEATASDRSMAVTSYPVAGALSIGSAFTGNRPSAQFAPANLDAIDVRGTARQQVEATPLDPFALYPFSVDLMTERMREHMRTAATSTLAGVAQLSSPLVNTVDLVITGTPGAVVALDRAGLDCVSTETGPQRVMPLWSQIGVQPAFLPTPAGADGQRYWQLGTHPLWWDFACPAGPSLSGLHYTATRTRMTSWTDISTRPIPGAIDVIRVDEVSSASLPACGMPADQNPSAFSDWEPAPGSDWEPDDPDYTVAFRHTTDATADRVRTVTGDWTDQLAVWAADAGYDTISDPVTFAIWAALAPFDLPAAIVLNPFVQHAVPLSAQLAVGGVLAGGGELVAKLPAASKAGAKLTFITTERATAEAAEGSVVLLEVDGADLAIPLTDGAADLALEQRAVSVVTTDQVSAGIPRTGSTPGWVEETFGEGRVCTREVGNCAPRRVLSHYPGPEWHGELDEDGFVVELDENGFVIEAPEFPEGEGVEPEPGIDQPEPPQVEAHVGQAPLQPPPAGYEALFPNNPSTSIVGTAEDFEESTSARVREAWETTSRFADQMGSVNAKRIALQLRGTGRSQSLALRTSDEPLYFYSTVPPGDVVGVGAEIGDGLRADPLALSNYHAGVGDEVNLVHAVGPDRNRSLFVIGSPDPRLSVRQLPLGEAATGYWIYEAQFRGGFNQLKTFRQAGMPGPFQPLSVDPGVVTRYDVVVPGGVPASAITGWKRIDVFPGTQSFEVTASSEEITAADREGWSFAGSTTHDWAVFDWYKPHYVGEVIEVSERPAVELLDNARRFDGVMIYTKQAGWVFYWEKQDVLTADFLRAAGFERGAWENVTGVEMWVPKSGQDYSVTVSKNFIPRD